MKQLLFLLSLVALLSSCGNKKWEYKTISVASEAHGLAEDPSIEDPTYRLSILGNEGWEVVGTYTEVRTRFPNFGNDEYVTGIRTNTATEVVTFVLKREARSSTSPKQ